MPNKETSSLSFDQLASVGGRIKHARNLKKLSQEDAGKALEISKRQYMRYENNQSPVTLHMLGAVATLFEVDPNWIASGLGSMRPSEPEAQNASAFAMLYREVRSIRKVLTKMANGSPQELPKEDDE